MPSNPEPRKNPLLRACVPLYYVTCFALTCYMHRCKSGGGFSLHGNAFPALIVELSLFSSIPLRPQHIANLELTRNMGGTTAKKNYKYV